MPLKKEIKNISNEYLIPLLLENIHGHLEANKLIYKNSFKKELKLLDQLIIQYHLLSSCIREPNEADKFHGRFFSAKHYVTGISTNFHAIKETYTSGLHIPFQLLLRSQIELVNTYISFIGDDDFYTRYAMDSKEKPNAVLTPKPSHSEKTIIKLLKEYNSQDFEECALIFREIMNYFYTDLSEAAHGNIPRIAIHSLQDTEDEETLYQPLFGVSNPLPTLKSMFRQSLNYFQITYRLAYIQITKKDMINHESPFIDFINHFSEEFQIISNKIK